MTTTINASTSSGLVQTADTSGILALQTAGTTAVTIDASQNVGIGTVSPAAKLNVKTLDGTNTAMISGTTIGARYTTDSSGIYIDGTDPTGGVSYQPLFVGGSVWGVRISGAERMRIDSSGDVLIGVNATTSVWDERLGVRLDTTGTGQVAFGAYAPSTSYASSMIRVQSENATGTAWNILEGRGNVGAVKVTIDGNGKGSFLGGVVVNGVNGLGYGTGAGGTVTQGTNKSTAVTLNKPTGQITMNNAALAATTTVTFTLNNSLLTTSDNIVFNLVSGTGTPSSYQVWAQMFAGGAFVNVRNISAGSLSEGIIIQYSIIKGATA